VFATLTKIIKKLLSGIAGVMVAGGLKKDFVFKQMATRDIIEIEFI